MASVLLLLGETSMVRDDIMKRLRSTKLHADPEYYKKHPEICSECYNYCYPNIRHFEPIEIDVFDACLPALMNELQQIGFVSYGGTGMFSNLFKKIITWVAKSIYKKENVNIEFAKINDYKRFNSRSMIVAIKHDDQFLQNNRFIICTHQKKIPHDSL